MLRVSALLSVLAVAVFAASGSSYWLVLFSATILATTRAPVEALADSIAIRSLGQRAQDFYGRIRLWSSIGFAASLVVWGFVLRYSGLSVILGGYAASMIVVWWRADTFGHTGHLPAIVSNRAHARLGGVGGVYAIFLVGVLLLGTAIGAASTFFPLWITGAGGSLSLVAVAGILGAIAEIPVMLWAGAVRRRFGAKGVFLLGGSAYVLTLLIWAQGPDPRVGAAMSVVRGAGFGLLYVGAVTSATWLLSPAALSTGQSLLQMTLMGLGPALGSSVGGVVFEALGAPSLFGLAALSLALGVAVIVVVLSPDFRRS